MDCILTLISSSDLSKFKNRQVAFIPAKQFDTKNVITSSSGNICYGLIFHYPAQSCRGGEEYKLGVYLSTKADKPLYIPLSPNNVFGLSVRETTINERKYLAALVTDGAAFLTTHPKAHLVQAAKL